MRRRTLAGIALASIAAGASPALGQRPGRRIVGFLSSRTEVVDAESIVGIRRGLSETGHVDGDNLTIEYRWAEGVFARLPALAAELVALGVEVIATIGGPHVPRAARMATPTLPIVFATGSDPVEEGLVRSLNRPGGNMTGIVVFTTSLGPKRLEILHELVPAASVIGFMSNPRNDVAARQVVEIEAAARMLGRQILVVQASTADEIDRAFALLSERRVGALLMSADSFYQVEADRLVSLAARHAIPTMYEWPQFVHAGGLISYAADRGEASIFWGLQVGRILNGASAGDLPIVRATKFAVSINLRTARALGLAVPQSLLAYADEVIE